MTVIMLCLYTVFTRLIRDSSQLAYNIIHECWVSDIIIRRFYLLFMFQGCFYLLYLFSTEGYWIIGTMAD